MKWRKTGRTHFTMEEVRAMNPAFAAKLEARPPVAPVVGPSSSPGKPAWSPAKPTTIPWVDGKLRTFASKTEARVAARLLAELPAGATIFCQVRVPLLSIAPRDGGTPFYLTVDFFIVYADGRFRAIDAKSPTRKSREWGRGRAAAERWLGVKIEELER